MSYFPFIFCLKLYTDIFWSPQNLQSRELPCWRFPCSHFFLRFWFIKWTNCCYFFLLMWSHSADHAFLIFTFSAISTEKTIPKSFCTFMGFNGRNLFQSIRSFTWIWSPSHPIAKPRIEPNQQEFHNMRLPHPSDFTTLCIENLRSPSSFSSGLVPRHSFTPQRIPRRVLISVLFSSFFSQGTEIIFQSRFVI